MFALLMFQTPAGGSNALLGFLPMLVLFAIFYFLLIMPMQRQRKQQKQMLQNLQPGNVVQTSGGLVGTILTLSSSDDTLVIRVKPDNIKLQIVRSAVAGLIAEK